MNEFDTDRPKILISPAHYYLDDNTHGGELNWVACILKGIVESKHYQLHVITGYVESIEIDDRYCTIHEIDKYAKANVNVFHALYFLIRKLTKSRRLWASNDFKIVHHILPFSIGATFDFDFIFRNRDKKYILGPVQNPQTFAAVDESVTEALHNKVFMSAFRIIVDYLCNLTLRNADSIVAINKRTKSMLVERGVEEKRIEIIAPGIDSSQFRYFPFEQKESDIVEVLSVGYLIRRKAFDLLIRATKEVSRAHKNIRLRIIGDGPQMVALKDMANDLGLNSHVIFEGFVPNTEVWKYYKRAHIFVSMSRSESWGQVYLEAMASGLPVISACNVGSEEIIKDGVFGYIVDQEDYQMLAQKLIYLIENKDQIAVFGRRGRAEVEKKYDWKTVIIPKYLELYDSLAERS